jgi:hypothetical protein
MDNEVITKISSNMQAALSFEQVNKEVDTVLLSWFRFQTAA